MVHRCLVLGAVVSVTSIASGARAQRTLSEDEVVELALSRAPLGELAEAEADLSHALGLVDGAWSNPELGYTREETFGLGGTGEDYAFVSARIDVSGRLFLRRDAGERRAEAARTSGEASRASFVASVRERFHRALSARRRSEALARWCDRVQAALAAVARRAEAGDAAPYDAARLERELRLASARRDEASADASALEAGLGVLTGIDGAFVLAGDVLPALDDGSIEALLSSADDGPALRSLAELEDAASLDAEASRRGWVPELILGAGYKGVAAYNDPAYRNDGFTLTVGITLPIFDTGSARTLRDEARGRAASITLEIESGRSRAAAVEAATRARELVAVAVRFAAERERSGDAVPVGAMRAYEGGELGILELLDAHRGTTEEELFLVDLALEARLAVIELERLAGRVEP